MRCRSVSLSCKGKINHLIRLPDKLIGASEREGYSIVATAMYWKGPSAKLEVFLAQGKKSHDKRDTIKERDWQRQKARIMKHSVR